MKSAELRKKKTRLSSKKRRYLQLLKSQPQREANPADLRDLQIQSVKKILKEKNNQLSRGQKKRLKKKEKFINSKLMENKAQET